MKYIKNVRFSCLSSIREVPDSHMFWENRSSHIPCGNQFRKYWLNFSNWVVCEKFFHFRGSQKALLFHWSSALDISCNCFYQSTVYRNVSKYSQISFIQGLIYLTSRASPVFQVSRSSPRPTISLSRDALRSVRKKWEEWGRGAFSWYGYWGRGGDPSRLKINTTLSFRDTWNKRDLAA